MKREFILIPWAVWSLDIPVNQRVILSEIISLHKVGRCFASSAHFAELTGLSVSAVRKNLSALLDAGLIERNWSEDMRRILEPTLTVDGYPPYPQTDRVGEQGGSTPLPADGNPPYPQTVTPPTLGRVQNRTENKTDNRTPKNIPSGLDEVIETFGEVGKESEAENFYNYYEANGWVQGAGKKPIKNWKAAARNWIRNAKKFDNGKQKGYTKTDWNRDNLENWANQGGNSTTSTG